MFDRGLLLLDLDTMETTMISDGSSGGGVSDAGWLVVTVFGIPQGIKQVKLSK